MKSELPSLAPRILVAALKKAGFQIKRTTGSHVIMFKPGLLRPISVPMHTKDLPKGTLRAIVRQANLTVEQLLNLLRE